MFASSQLSFNLTTTLATANPLTNAAYALSGSHQQYTLTYTAAASDAGKYVRVSFANVGPSGTYINTDNHALAVSTVPESRGFCMAIAGGVVALIVIRCREQTIC